MKSCKNCKYSMKSKELSSEYRLCKIDNEMKFVYEYCNNYRRRGILSWLYDYIIFVLTLVKFDW